jgi:hypothetical protein
MSVQQRALPELPVRLPAAAAAAPPTCCLPLLLHLPGLLQSQQCMCCSAAVVAGCGQAAGKKLAGSCMLWYMQCCSSALARYTTCACICCTAEMTNISTTGRASDVDACSAPREKSALQLNRNAAMIYYHAKRIPDTLPPARCLRAEQPFPCYHSCCWHGWL